MPLFAYVGRDGKGGQVKGQQEAATMDAVASTLMGRGITPVAINPASDVKEQVPLEVRFQRLMGSSGVSVEELIILCRQMYTITKAGIPLVRGVRGLAESIKHYVLQKTLFEIADRLEAGMELSVSMRYHTDVFSSLFISMVRVGENSGRLDSVFLQMAEYLERELDTARRIKSALRYPSFVLIALAVAMVVINIFVIPAFANMFSRFDAELPLPTKILIGVSDTFVNYWPHMLIVVAVSVGLWWRYMKTDNGQRFWGETKIRLPIIGDIINRASLARYARSFSLMSSSGVPLPTALALCAESIDNRFLMEKILGMKSGVERGESLIRTHTASKMFTPLVLQMVSVGEESGQVDELLKEVAEFYEREVDYDVSKLSDRIEPIILVIMAVFVMILALGIFLPMWEMYNIQK
ncbi:type II secretion system F family protein [Marinibactrum halimedae]|uniref:MSHA biogenesis protein MshG n=1 Tax=Marinibactrum halimedae TaxID=1444977 RepID=A0AA37T4J2_9GAMM|nr:type II secretion system F family protein [Marinibactrum halimedae]MCD9460820.1 type II secretion system F family protein [Marinibactrum halimedae]GLS26715.1 MSHA biogenesis protein MshG [Marinibactrum halimedae]